MCPLRVHHLFKSDVLDALTMVVELTITNVNLCYNKRRDIPGSYIPSPIITSLPFNAQHSSVPHRILNMEFSRSLNTTFYTAILLVTKISKHTITPDANQLRIQYALRDIIQEH